MRIPIKSVMLFVLAIALNSNISHAETTDDGVAGINKDRASKNYIINCQGCHLSGGEGSDGGAPSMVGVVANFLNAPGGREFLLRVPGVATTALKSDAVAEMMNWLIYEFDAEHVPADFKPFTTQEVQMRRKKPYVQEAAKIRKQLVAFLETKQ